ncbi:Uncharacterised protein [Vibrio cholerae]|nr:Uncharacterised protein [Vibrio cholerae]CSI85570.1 Uncharacterised protein [Vibrio cholerae]
MRINRLNGVALSNTCKAGLPIGCDDQHLPFTLRQITIDGLQ